jgi:hypothetical protein
MLRHRFVPARLAALALAALLLTGGSARAQIVYEFADATTGAAQTTFSMSVGGALPVRLYLHELTPGAPLFHSAGGLGSGAVRLSFNTPPGVAGLSAADVTPATTATGGPWDFGTPSLSPSGTSAALADAALAAGVQPDAQGRILLGTFTLHGLAPGAVALGAADPNPAIGFDTSSFAAGADGAPLINDDPLIAAATATLTVSPVPEPAGVLAAGAAAAGLAGAARRIRRARAAGPAPSSSPV